MEKEKKGKEKTEEKYKCPSCGKDTFKEDECCGGSKQGC